ncbi:hypothetical protein ACJ3XI_02400 [Litorimonas sp. RW-G-Af-16]|uniref:hypothetical protein n=1 Tax=Litorimonas sp. RW-G-Af-16 TaxID=3241168 RepID=UPI00390C4857
MATHLKKTHTFSLKLAAILTLGWISAMGAMGLLAYVMMESNSSDVNYDAQATFQPTTAQITTIV